MSKLLEQVETQRQKLLWGVLPEKKTTFIASETYLRPESFGRIHNPNAQHFVLIYFSESNTLLRINHDLTNVTYLITPLTHSFKIVPTKYFDLPNLFKGCILKNATKTEDTISLTISVPRQEDNYRIYYNTKTYNLINYFACRPGEVSLYPTHWSDCYVDNNGHLICGALKTRKQRVHSDVAHKKVVSVNEMNGKIGHLLICVECIDEEYALLVLNLNNARSEKLLNTPKKIYNVFNINEKLFIIFDNYYAVQNMW